MYKSSTFAKLFAFIAGVYWLPKQDMDMAQRVQVLHEIHPNFVLNISMVQTEGIKGYVSKQDVRSFPTIFPYLFHEHKVVGNEHCHSRVEDSAYIFIGILDACAKCLTSSLSES
jgi:hypothetical protein